MPQDKGFDIPPIKTFALIWVASLIVGVSAGNPGWMAATMVALLAGNYWVDRIVRAIESSKETKPEPLARRPAL